jgi:pantoate--beta-alanine ligase
MRLISTIADMRGAVREARSAGHRVALVPTMGYLHEGHRSLARLARRHADVVAVSIFVNPTQFGPGEDFSRYPRDLERDARMCEAEGVDYVFHPSVEAMYAPDASVSVDESRLSRGLCGAARPGHFRGVVTVVSKLFNIVLPDVAIFGEKDAQQLRIVRRLVRDLDFPVEILAGPTVREADGLAMSSRNSLLAPGERRDAVCLRRSLDEAGRLFGAGERNAAALLRAVRECVGSYPSARIDYAELVDDETMEPVETVERNALLALAVFFSKTRLIDNTVLAS